LPASNYFASGTTAITAHLGTSNYRASHPSHAPGYNRTFDQRCKFNG
jgi:hypothetical protein